MDGIYGLGGHASVIADSFENFSPNKYFYIHPDAKPNDLHQGSYPVYRPKDIPDNCNIFLAIGDNSTRLKVFENISKLRKNIKFPNRKHKNANQAKAVTMGKGNHLLVYSWIGPSTRIGDFNIINTAATVDHDCQIGDFTHIAPGAHLCGSVTVGDLTLIGVGSVVIPGVSIGRNSIIGAGSVVVKDIPDGVVAYGNPCQIRKENECRS